MKKYVLDTNVLLNDPNALFAFEENAVIIPYTVLEELDNIKHRKTDLSRDARFVTRLIEQIVGDHEDLSNGVHLNEVQAHMPDDAMLYICTEADVKSKLDLLPPELVKSEVPDDKIIIVALATDSILVTRDILMRIKAQSFGVKVQDYRHDTAIEDSDMIHVGHHHVEGSVWEEWCCDNIFNSNTKGVIHYYFPTSQLKLDMEICIGDYVFDDVDFIGIYEGIEEHKDKKDGTLHQCYKFKFLNKEHTLNESVWKIKPLNEKQALAINSILDPDVHITVLLGSAGTGKTLITLATALELAMEKKRHQTKIYERIVFTKTQDSLFEDIGFLPGTEEQKVIPFCGAAFDALEFLHKDDVDTEASVEYLLESGKIRFHSLTTSRGKSYRNTILVVDEFQNFTPAMAKSILTRAGENCKVIIMGNLNQIDNQYITPINSGLTYVTEKFKNWEGCRIIELEGVLRSPLAEFAEKNL